VLAMELQLVVLGLGILLLAMERVQVMLVMDGMLVMVGRMLSNQGCWLLLVGRCSLHLGQHKD
jgi:hypothetical protein